MLSFAYSVPDASFRIAVFCFALKHTLPPSPGRQHQETTARFRQFALLAAEKADAEVERVLLIAIDSRGEPQKPPSI